MIQISKILCPVDFSEFSRDALDHAVALANWYRAELLVLYVFVVPSVPVPAAGFPVGSLTPMSISPGDIADELKDFAGGVIGSADIRWEAVVSRWEAVVSPGITAAVEIARQAERMAADLIVIGTHGKSGFDRFLLGSVTERLLRVATAPMMTVPPRSKRSETERYRSILCPIDFSGESMRALRYALSLAQEADARLTLLHVVEGLLDEPAEQDFRDLNILDYYQRLEKRARERLTAAVPDEARVWSRPTEQVVKGKAYQQILRIAEEGKYDLIVMGVRGRGALSRFAFGSTADRVIRQADCPVLTIRSQ